MGVRASRSGGGDAASAVGRPPASLRRQLEELAREVAAATPGVGSAACTAVAVPGGRFGVALRLAAELVPLRPLADEVRSRIVTAAVSAGLAEALGPVDIAIDDIVAPDEGDA